MTDQVGAPGQPVPVSQTSARMAELLGAAAHAFDDGRNPFLEEFLTEHDVTSDECMAMSKLIGAGALIVAQALLVPGTVLTRWVDLKVT